MDVKINIYFLRPDPYILLVYDPGWESITKERHCGGSGSMTVPHCDETDPSVYIHIADDDEYLACERCDSYFNLVYSIRFGVNPYTIEYFNYGWGWIPVRIYLGWFYTLSDCTDYPFDPKWNLCDTPLADLCDEL